VVPAALPRRSRRIERSSGAPLARTSALRRSLALTAAFFAADVAFAADAQHGEQLARRWCASCHVISPDQRGPVIEAPPFATIAQRSDFDAARLARFLLDPHPKMPNMELSRAEAADLAAFIASLK